MLGIDKLGRAAAGPALHGSRQGAAGLRRRDAARRRARAPGRRTTITTRAGLQIELEGVHDRGYALLVDELEPGLSAVAAPVRERDGEVVAVLCVSGATLRLPRQRLDLLGRLCVEQADELSVALGWTPA